VHNVCGTTLPPWLGYMAKNSSRSERSASLT
jgi:hypothetical protein